MRPPKTLQISEQAAMTLNEWYRSTTLPHGQIMRAKIVLQLSEGMTPTQVAIAQRTSAKTVHRWRNRFETDGVDGLLEQARAGARQSSTKRPSRKSCFLPQSVFLRRRRTGASS